MEVRLRWDDDDDTSGSYLKAITNETENSKSSSLLFLINLRVLPYGHSCFRTWAKGPAWISKWPVFESSHRHFFIKIIYYLAVKKAQHYLHCILNLLGLCRSSPVRASKSGLKTSEFSCKVKKSDHETAFIRKVIFERLIGFFKKGHPRSLFILSFHTNITFLQQINVKNVHPVYGAGIQTHDLQNMSRHPLPLDQGSHQLVPILNFRYKSFLDFLNNCCTFRQAVKNALLNFACIKRSELETSLFTAFYTLNYAGLNEIL